ncbi:MAG: hypothetical protein QOH63_2179 [Acidobacteriota bacterium]|nr:hypothetical protein [Acidobacteriota bacterium]
MLRNTLFSKFTFPATLITVLFVVTFSCSASRQLDRKKAADLIQRSSGFTQPYVMVIRHKSDQWYLDPVDPSETRQQGEARAVESYYQSYPYRAVLRELNLINVRATYVSTTMFGSTEGKSTYDLDVSLSPQGEQLWRNLGMEPDSSAIPLGRRKLVAITGITGGDAAKGARGTAEFTWQWELTTAGASMSKGTPEFERLPDAVKQMFESPTSSYPTFKSKVPLSLVGIRQGIANFQLYDDGWRLDNIEPARTSPLNPLD